MRRGVALLLLFTVTFAGTAAAAAGSPGQKHSRHPRARQAALAVKIVGLPPAAHPSVTIAGPRRYRLRLTRAGTIARLVPGRYSVTAARLHLRSITYAPSVGSTRLVLVAGKQVIAVVHYRRLRTPAPKPSTSAPVDVAAGVDAPGVVGGPPAAGGGGSGGGGGAGSGGGDGGGGSGSSSGSGSGGGGAGGSGGAPSDGSTSSGGAGGGSAGPPTPPADGPPSLKTPAPSGFVCSLTSMVNGPPKQIVVTVQDATNGIRDIVVTTTNATAVTSTYAPGTTAPIQVTATKVDQSQGATLTLTITNGTGQKIICS